MPLHQPVAESGRTATLVVAASDATHKGKAQADYVCDGLSDQVEIQAAIDALPNVGGRVVLTEGTYYLSAGIVILKHNVTVEGQGSSTLVQAATGSEGIPLFLLGDGGATTYANLGLAHMKVASVLQKTSNAGITINKCFKVWLDSLYLERQYRALYIQNSTQVWVTNCAIRDTKENGITIESDLAQGFDWYIDNLVMDNPGVANVGIGIQWLGGETLVMSGADIMRFNVGMEIQPGNGRECRWAFFSQVILDTCGDNGLHIGNSGTGNVAGLTFANCWTGSNANYGVLVDKNGSGYLQGIRFIGHKAMNNGLAGVRFAGGQDLSISDSDIVSNSATVSGARAGIEVACSEVGVTNCRCTNGYGHGASQDWGIRVDTGPIDYYRIHGCDLRGNIQAAGLTDGGTGTHKVVTDNLP